MRFERKYRIEGKPAATVKQLLRFHPASFRELYPDRQVNNIYFDTPALETFHQNVYGKNERKKFRVRWYGEILDAAGEAQLEIKIKHNELGEKQSFAVQAFSLPDIESLTQEVNRVANGAVMQPILLNAYRRSYLISRDGRFRVTVDRDMRYHTLLASAWFHRYQIADDAVIVEVKYEEAEDEYAPFITQHMPFRQAKHSKYVQGIQLTI
ncbi:MAG: polyphosphate polymerase domain-containing protein [Bacteroidota bacterium]